MEFEEFRKIIENTNSIDEYEEAIDNLEKQGVREKEIHRLVDEYDRRYDPNYDPTWRERYKKRLEKQKKIRSPIYIIWIIFFVLFFYFLRSELNSVQCFVLLNLWMLSLLLIFTIIDYFTKKWS